MRDLGAIGRGDTIDAIDKRDVYRRRDMPTLRPEETERAKELLR